MSLIFLAIKRPKRAQKHKDPTFCSKARRHFHGLASPEPQASSSLTPSKLKAAALVRSGGLPETVLGWIGARPPPHPTISQDRAPKLAPIGGLGF